MRLRQIVDIAKQSDLKQIIIGEDEEQVAALLNLALIEVYGTLNLIQEEQIIPVHTGQTRYLVQENTQRVLSVCDQDGVEMGLNDDNDPRSVFMPTPFEIHVTEPLMTGKGEKTPYDKPLSSMSLVISTTPPYITKANIDTVDLIIPEALLEALLSYMSYRAYISMNGDQQTEYSVHLQRHQKAMIELFKKGFVGQSIMTNLKSKQRGFA